MTSLRGSTGPPKPMTEPEPCGCNPCECDLSEKEKYERKDLCSCRPCDCDLVVSDETPRRASLINKDNVEPCGCTVCECDLSEKAKYDEKDLCHCNPCECDPPETRTTDKSGRCARCDSRVDPGMRKGVGHKHGHEHDSCIHCSTGAWCPHCDGLLGRGQGQGQGVHPHTEKSCFNCTKSGWCTYCDGRIDDGMMARNYRKYRDEMLGEYGEYEYGGEYDENARCPCGSRLCICSMRVVDENGAGDQEMRRQMEQLYEPCELDRYTLPPSPVPSDHTFENLDRIRREFCRQCFPKNLGMILGENLLLDILIKNPFGDFEMLLPGNQIYPGLLKSRITDEDMPMIVNVLLEVRGITKLNLCYNEVTDAGVEILAPALQECGNLIELNLMHNNLTAAGVLSLCKALLHRAPLHSLKLTGMKIGNEGMNALTCLILSGRAPLDLDIGECDLTCEGFQSLCSALHAMDHDVDYPNYLLLKNNLPMDLVRLKEAKADYNEEVDHVTQLNRVSSQPTFVRVKSDIADPNPSDGSQVGQDQGQGQDGCPAVDFPELFESFSATILQGLFDLRHRFSEDDMEDKQTELWNDPAYQLDSLTHNAKAVLPKVSRIIENFRRSRSGEGEGVGSEDEWDGELSQKSESMHLISRSLYSLEVNDDDDIIDPIALGAGYWDNEPDTLIDKSKRKGQDRDSIQDGTISSELDLHDESTVNNPPDFYTAEAAASFMVRETLYTAAKESRKTEYMDRSDITQLLLMTVIDTIERVNRKGDRHLSEDDCHRILEDAMEKVYRTIKPRIPPTCTLNKQDIDCFFRTIFSVSQGTFMHLLENPFVAQALVEQGTAGCVERERGKQVIQGPQGAMTEEQIRRIAISFLHGCFVEAARAIGLANPFGLEENVEKDLACTEIKIEPEVDELMEKAAEIAVATKEKARAVEETNQEYTQAADNFVVDLFENIGSLVMETEIKANVTEHEGQDGLGGPTVYKYVSRPTRLVLNRPLFGEANAAIMAAKLGDYIGSNTSVTALVAEKWELAEEGMAALMEKMMDNRTLVVLNLANNRLAADGIKLLGQFIAQNPSLKHLVLHHNGIRDAGMAHLNEAISQGCSLCSLDIAYNRISHKQLDPLLTILPSTNIRALYIWGNKFGPESWNILRTLYESNILDPKYTDVILQRAGQEKMVVKNMQVRDVNEYYQVPAVIDKGLYLPPSYTDDSHKVRHKQPVVSVA